MKIRFASVNEQKIRDAREFLEQSGIEIISFPVRIVEQQTEDLHQLVSDKLMDAFKMIGKPVFVEHSGLFINSLNGFPGGLTQTFWDRLHAVRFSELIGNLDDPSAVARSLIGYCDGRKRHFFEGEVTGRISREPAGAEGFEWDNVFIPDGYSCTFAELGGVHNELSMRKRALDAFINHLRRV
ncbi:non-canonical purine NTP pyrophosphatase [Pseudomonas stutzeri]|uniref:non-canonical purine NTP pyrophosphatase n=1 Tax=Pseudomonadaceae TaxID=135621 RepID=UPI00103C5B33|nr:MULTISPECIES: non-canonical purine NTP pyrophosphatase [Pseudomonadaceae]MBA1278659.1 non-canonical purine NTP pyrophosphatase [Stutzerimonas stutzeri]MBC8648073.1 non-canonical purine NTP pyrophosphatase [Pseudomonas sp. MT4]MCQ4309903.1 non-canonical purine NTP pyrophosphatase [Stutzerimonas stutzeri]QXY93971.1 non-canonical purine NTP pyrophosphatase [Pseudomonas sp. MTM4]TCD23984.1 non-canonical purine NTP pyrophosphatase [Pseudomonas sp. IC_126]